MYRRFSSMSLSRTRCTVALLMIAGLTVGALVLGGCGSDHPTSPPPPNNTGFDDGYVVDNWVKTTILDGTTDIALVADTDMEEARFTYSVDLGNHGNGVSERTAQFSVPASASGSVTVDWTYTGFHAFFAAYAELSFFADDGSGGAPTPIVEVDHQDVSGNFTFSGSTTFDVVEGEDFGFEIGGANFDSNDQISGTLQITRLVAPR